VSIAALRAEIRRRRRVVELAGGKWQVLSTAGDYHHEVSYGFAFMDFQCDTCMSRFGNRKCWARRRVIEFVQASQVAPATATREDSQ